MNLSPSSDAAGLNKQDCIDNVDLKADPFKAWQILLINI